MSTNQTFEDISKLVLNIVAIANLGMQEEVKFSVRPFRFESFYTNIFSFNVVYIFDIFLIE
jgi:hypothetical protein